MYCWRCGRTLEVDPPARGVWYCRLCGARFTQATVSGAPTLVQYAKPWGAFTLADDWYVPLPTEAPADPFDLYARFLPRS